MASQTTHYQLTKPASDENYDISIFNRNFDNIDAQMYQNETLPFTGATSSSNGVVGNVPAPLIGDEEKFLKGDGTWGTPSGGGGGSSVTITPTLSSGTKIADYSIDGVSNSLYAPSGGGSGGSTFETVFAGSKSTSSWNSPLVFNEFDVTAYDIIRITAALDGDSYVWLLDTDIIPVKPANTLHILGEAYCDRDNTSFEMYVSSGHNLSVSKIEGLVEGTGSSMVHYSTTEHQVGTWIDGSDVYEKTISISNVSLSSGGYETVDTITGLDTIISCNGYVVEGNLKYTLNDITLRVVQDGTSVKLYSPSGTTWTISSGAIIIRYIKASS